MKVIINENCINCGHCYTEVDKEGKVFKEGDGVAKVIEGADFEANKEMIQKAVDECPVAAIEIVEDAPVDIAVESTEGVVVDNTSEPEIPMESVPVTPEITPEPVPETSAMPIDDEIPLG